MAEAVLVTARGEAAEMNLVARAQRGDRQAAEELLRQVELPVWRTCRALLPEEEDLEAAVQEVLVKILKGLRTWRGEGNLVAWATVVAANHARDLLRRRRLLALVPLEGDEEKDEPHLSAVVPSSSPDPERTLRARQGLARLQQALWQLPARQQEVFSLRYFAQLSLKEIAQQLSLDEGTVKRHLHRALARLRPQVEEAWP
jgi:RNA polymerase sigma-70 factor (ECF subfamily)